MYLFKRISPGSWGSFILPDSDLPALPGLAGYFSFGTNLSLVLSLSNSPRRGGFEPVLSRSGRSFLKSGFSGLSLLKAGFSDLSFLKAGFSGRSLLPAGFSGFLIVSFYFPVSSAFSLSSLSLNIESQSPK
jgi:hypothetical protein